MRFLIEAVYCMTWIWTLHRAHNQWKSPIEEDNVWANVEDGSRKQSFLYRSVKIHIGLQSQAL